MSSTESSAASAESTATLQPAGVPAAASTFGTSRGSGLARGKRSTGSTAPATAAPATEYTPTAIEIVNAPREYKNPFAPEAPAAPEAPEVAPAAVISEPAPAPIPSTPVVAVAPAPVEPSVPAESSLPVERAELNILPPEEPKSVAPQTWESEGFEPGPAREREPRQDRPRREFRREDERRDNERREEVVPSKFRYERAKDGPLPPRPAPGNAPSAPRAVAVAPTPAKSGGFLGWLKSLFGSTPAPTPTTEARSNEPRPEGREGQRHRRHRGGRGRSQYQGQGAPYQGGENRSRAEGNGDRHEGGGDRRGGGGHHRRRRHGHGHGQGQEHRDQGGGHSGPAAT